MFWRIGPCIGLQSDSILLTDGGGGVFMVLGVDGGGRYQILVMFCVRVDVGVE